MFSENSTLHVLQRFSHAFEAAIRNMQGLIKYLNFIIPHLKL